MLKTTSLTKPPSHQENLLFLGFSWCPWRLGDDAFLLTSRKPVDEP
jgi:hypothetical protein